MLIPINPGTDKHPGYVSVFAWLILAMTVFLAGFAYPLKQKVRFYRTSIEEGLSQSSVNCIFKDSRELMWFGTQDGLNCYDGYSFKIFMHDPGKPDSLSNNDINSIYEDHQGLLWIGTADGLDLFERESETFIHYKKDLKPPFRVSGNEITAICEDKGGVLWVGTADGGFNKYDLKENKFIAYHRDIHNSAGLISNHIAALYSDSAGVMWIGTLDRGLTRWDQKDGSFFHYQHVTGEPTTLSNNRVTTIGEDRQGNLWVGTTAGLNRLNPQKNTFQCYFHDPSDPDSIGGNQINCIYPDHDGDLLIGTEGGVHRFNPEQGTFSHWRSDPTDPHSLSNNVVLSIFEDSSHILWIGTDGGGFNKYAPYRNRFDLYQFNPYYPDRGLSGKIVYALYQDRAGFTWIGTDQGLNRFDGKTDSFRHYKSEPGKPGSLSSDYVFSIYEDRSGIIWVGTWGGGLNRFDRPRGKFSHYLPDPGEPLSISSNIARVIYEDRAGVLWIGTEGGGLNRCDRDKNVFLHYKTVEDNPASISDNHIRAIVGDPDGSLWIGTRRGLNHFDGRGGGFVRYTAQANNLNSLSHNQVNTIYIDANGILWIGTSGGLNRFEPGSAQFTPFNVADGLPNHVIWGILEDPEGNLWLSTNKGLSKFNPRRKTFRNYDIRDGLQSNEYNLGACLKTRDGEMFFGGINGFNSFRPGNIKDNPNIPPIIITGIKYSLPEEPRLFPRFKKPGNQFDQAGEIRLFYREYAVSFEFAALDYTSPAHNRYAYMMQGLDKSWIDAGTRRFASYNALPPGRYVFKVKGSNSDGVWNETGASLRIRVLPPFWQTWWFLGVVLFILAAAMYLFYQARTTGIRKRAKQLEQINENLNRQIAARKEIEEKAQKIELRLKTFLETSSEGFLELDNQEIVRDVNPEICAILYRSRQELLGRNAVDFIYPQDIDKFRRHMEIPRSGMRGSYSLTLLRPDHSLAYCMVKTAPLLDENRKVKGAAVMVTDITEIIQAELELQQTKNYLDNVFNSLSSMLVSVSREGVITHWNTAAENYTGVPTREAVARNVCEVAPFLMPYRDLLRSVFRSGETLELHRERVNVGKEDSRFLDIVVYPLVYEGLAGSVIRMDDVTEAERKDRQLLQAQKMETVGNLAGGLAHDFNNVLGGIVGTVSLIKYLLEKEQKLNLAKLKNQVDTIEKSACRAVNLVNQLLTLSRKNEPLFAFVDLNDALKDVLKICENTFDKSIKFNVSFYRDKAILWADASQVEQVLLNLCINASQAMTLMRKMDEPQGGTLGISIKSIYADQAFCISQPEADEGNYWVVEVSDTGVGINSKVIAKIFDPFFTTKAKAQGTGLGLAMVYNIVKQHHGFIDVSSRPGRGSTFRIYLPHSEEQEYFAKHPPAAGTMIRGFGLILVVDDEESLRVTLKEILEICGYQVLLAEDGNRGVEIFKEKHAEIKLILLDLAMPNMAGKETYLEMKKIFPPVKVLLTSGFKHDLRVKEIIKLGVDGFLPKPFTMVELSKKIAEII